MEYHSGGSLPLLGRPRYCPGASANGGYLCETGHCCGETGCCTYYYELWWFWLLWTVLILFSCCCAYRHRRAKLRVQQQQRQREISLLAYHGASSYPSSMLDLSFLASLKLPSYEEVAAQPSTPPPPYSSVFTAPRYPQPPRASDPHLLTRHDPLLHQPLSDGPSSLSSDNSSSCSCDSCCPSSPCSSSLSPPVTYETDTSHATTPGEAAPLAFDVAMETITAAATCLAASEGTVNTRGPDAEDSPVVEVVVMGAASPDSEGSLSVTTSPMKQMSKPVLLPSPSVVAPRRPSIQTVGAEALDRGPGTSDRSLEQTRTSGTADDPCGPNTIPGPDASRASVTGPASVSTPGPSPSPVPIPACLNPTPSPKPVPSNPTHASTRVPSNLKQAPEPVPKHLISVPDPILTNLTHVPNQHSTITTVSDCEKSPPLKPAYYNRCKFTEPTAGSDEVLVPPGPMPGSPFCLGSVDLFVSGPDLAHSEVPTLSPDLVNASASNGAGLSSGSGSGPALTFTSPSPSHPDITIKSESSSGLHLSSPPSLLAPALLLDPLAALHQSNKGGPPPGHASSLSPSPRATQSPPKQTLFSPCVDVFEPGPPSWAVGEEEREEDEEEEEDIGADESQYRHRRLTGDSGIEVCRCRVEEEEEEEEEERDMKGGGDTELHDSADCIARGHTTVGEGLRPRSSASTATPEDAGKVVVVVVETV
uniref:Uncharacterized protein n=1 Tax=Gasterosteus aculeatus aculeatus TaxID=481459 RepID=A0AAQ4P517_GASAC|nr:mucin-5AC-like [Gasterosteus aculeatus aculeatus]